MKATPAFILRNCVLWADNDVKAGQTSDIGLNMPKEKTESFRNGGMIKERKAAMVSNLMTVLCSDRSTQPVVNTGTLNN